MLALFFLAIVSAGLAITSYFEVRPTQRTTYGLPTLGDIPFDITPSPLPFFDTCPRLSPIQISYYPLACTTLHDIALTLNPIGFVPIAVEHLIYSAGDPIFNRRLTTIYPEGVARFRDVPPEFAVDNFGMFLIVAQLLVIIGLSIIRIPPRVVIKYVDQTAKDLYISMLMEKLSRLARKRKETKATTDKSIADLDDRVADLDGQVVHLNRRLRTAKFQMDILALGALRFEEELATSQEELTTTRHNLDQRDSAIASMTQHKTRSDAELDSLRKDVSGMRTDMESRDNALSAAKRDFEEQLNRIRDEHQASLADMRRKYEEDLKDEEHRHELIVRAQAKEIMDLESTVVSARATVAKLELRVEELELVELATVSPPTPPTTPPTPTAEQSDIHPTTSKDALQPNLTRDVPPGTVTTPADPIPTPIADLSPPAAFKTVEHPSFAAITPASSWSASRGAFSDAPRGLNDSMWAPKLEDDCAIAPSGQAQGSNDVHQQGGGRRTNRQKRNNPAYSGTRYDTPKRRGPQQQYDQHDRRS